MSLNTWYYTLSTISQTLAGVLALAAVFTVLRLESLTKSISNYKARALEILRAKEKHISSGKKSWDTIKIILEDLKEFNENYEIKYRHTGGVKGEMERLSDRYENLIHISDIDLIENTYKNLNSFVDQRDGLIRMVKWPGITTSVVIVMSILFLGLSDWVVSSCMFLVLLLVVMSALFAIWSVIRACWNILLAIKILE